MRHAAVERRERTGEGFAAIVAGDRIAARTVLLATGVVNHRPRMDDADHAAALAHGLLRYCPICDGFAVTAKRVAVIGSRPPRYRQAVFLRLYTADLTLTAELQSGV